MILLVPIAIFVLWACLQAHEYWDSNQRASWISASSLGLSLASVLLAFGAIVYGGMHGGFKYYDPPLMRIYFYGFLISLGGIIFGLLGTFFPNSARWQAPLAALGMFLFWFVCAATE